MKKFIILLTIIGLITTAHAAPFLVCDPDSSATSYVIVLDNNEAIETPAPLRYDLSNIPEGTHVIEVRAKNIWGVSNAIPFSFVKQLPPLPTNIQLLNEVSMWQAPRDNFWNEPRITYWTHKRG